MTKHAIEIVEFKLNQDTDHKAFLASIEATKGFVSGLDGFIERHTAQTGEGNWVDVVKWRDLGAAHEAAKKFGSAEEVKDFVIMIDHSSMKMQHYEVEATM